MLNLIKSQGFPKSNILFQGFCAQIKQAETNCSQKLIVENIPYEAEKMFKEEMKNKCPIQKISLGRNKHDLFNGSAIIYFDSQIFRDQLMSQKIKIKENELVFKEYLNKEQLEKQFQNSEKKQKIESQIFIRNIPIEVADVVIKKLFSDYGEILKFSRLKYQNMAIIQFENPSIAKKALEKNNSTLNEQKIYVQQGLALKRKELKKELNNQRRESQKK